MNTVATPASPAAPVLAPARLVTIKLYSQISGKTEAAIRKKIERGIWVEGKQYRRDPEGCIWIITRGVEQWVEGTA